MKTRDYLIYQHRAGEVRPIGTVDAPDPRRAFLAACERFKTVGTSVRLSIRAASRCPHEDRVAAWQAEHPIASRLFVPRYLRIADPLVRMVLLPEEERGAGNPDSGTL